MAENFQESVVHNFKTLGKMSGFHPRDLIKEVKCRPAIFNRELLEQPRREHKHHLWLEVAGNLTPAEDWNQYSEVEKDARSKFTL